MIVRRKGVTGRHLFLNDVLTAAVWITIDHGELHASGKNGWSRPHLIASGVATVISSAKPTDAVSESARMPSANLTMSVLLDFEAELQGCSRMI
jgi:hypothetical protein